MPICWLKILLIIMDEPTLGIDLKVWELLQLIRELVEEDNRTILLASHLLHQVQEVCDKVGIFVKENDCFRYH